MLVCGSIVTIKDVYKGLKAFADKGHFVWVMVFGQAHMQPCLTNPLLQMASVSWFIQERRWDALLDDFQSIGAHTDIFILQKDEPTMRYVWSHPAKRPFGEIAPYSCPDCKSYKAWGAPEVEVQMDTEVKAGIITHTCMNKKCKKQIVYQQREALIRHTLGASGWSSEWYREVKV
ncbi:hypothetical protein FPV67DRAFT_1669500 [Lyophyllum atratum]|nr:hypothetical protein FPV67DRAFT_1669500 [Lyophyllum atratum]